MSLLTHKVVSALLADGETFPKRVTEYNHIEILPRGDDFVAAITTRDQLAFFEAQLRVNTVDEALEALIAAGLIPESWLVAFSADKDTTLNDVLAFAVRPKEIETVVSLMQDLVHHTFVKAETLRMSAAFRSELTQISRPHINTVLGDTFRSFAVRESGSVSELCASDNELRLQAKQRTETTKPAAIDLRALTVLDYLCDIWSTGLIWEGCERYELASEAGNKSESALFKHITSTVAYRAKFTAPLPSLPTE